MRAFRVATLWLRASEPVRMSMERTAKAAEVLRKVRSVTSPPDVGDDGKISRG
jgi:hypothetical protein